MIKGPKECNLHSKSPFLKRISCSWPILHGASVLWVKSSLLGNRWCTRWMLAEGTMERHGSSPQRWAAGHWDAVFVACSQWRAGHHMLCCHWLRGDVHSHRDVWEISWEVVRSEANSQQLNVPTAELFFDSDVPGVTASIVHKHIQSLFFPLSALHCPVHPHESESIQLSKHIWS